MTPKSSTLANSIELDSAISKTRWQCIEFKNSPF